MTGPLSRRHVASLLLPLSLSIFFSMILSPSLYSLAAFSLLTTVNRKHNKLTAQIETSMREHKSFFFFNNYLAISVFFSGFLYWIPTDLYFLIWQATLALVESKKSLQCFYFQDGCGRLLHLGPFLLIIFFSVGSRVGFRIWILPC